MYIGIDANEANTPQKVGSNVYAFHLLAEMYRQAPDTNFSLYLKQPPRSDLPQPRASWSYRVFGPARAWTQWRLPLDLYLRRPRPSLFFSPSHYAPRFSPVPTVVTVFDLAFHYFPETYKPRVLSQLTAWTRYSVSRARHVLTISEHTKADLVKVYGLPPEKITVTYPGPHLSGPAAGSSPSFSSLAARLRLPGRYLLFIGTRQPRKNLSRLIQALNLANRRLAKPIFLVVAGKTWHQFAAESFPESPQVIFTGFLPDPELRLVLAHAHALIFPSLYEGFGIPVLEAMNAGVPVAAAHTSSLPEITGDHLLSFDPTDVQAMAQVIKKITQLNPDLRQKLIQQGKIRGKLFTWERAARTTLEVLHELSLS